VAGQRREETDVSQAIATTSIYVVDKNLPDVRHFTPELGKGEVKAQVAPAAMPVYSNELALEQLARRSELVLSDPHFGRVEVARAN
jgi:hypothetical protein